MNSFFFKFSLFFFLSCLVAGYSFADSKTFGRDGESPYMVGKIDDVNYELNTIKFYGQSYHYTPSTLIMFKNQQKTTEYSLVPGTRVRLMSKVMITSNKKDVFELSEIIIREVKSK